MLEKLRNNARAILLAVLVHLALIAMLVISLDWTPKPQPAGTQPAVVKATVVDDSKIRAAQQKKQDEAERRKRAEQEAAEKMRAEEQRRAEENRLAEEASQRKAEDAQREEQAAQEKIRQEQLAAEQKRKETAKREAAMKEKQRTEQLRREEEKRLAAAEAQRKIESEKKRKAEKEAQQRKEAEQLLKDQLASEEQAAQEQQAQTLIGQYIPLIQSRVKSRWVPPPSAKSGMSCTVTVRLVPGGEVVGARVTVSSGDAVFDRSVESAVYKASPLPLPPDPALFEYFRELNFIFKP